MKLSELNTSLSGMWKRGEKHVKYHNGKAVQKTQNLENSSR
jgi:hypothetical protein